MVRNAQKMISRMFFIVGYFPHLGGVNEVWKISTHFLVVIASQTIKTIKTINYQEVNEVIEDRGDMEDRSQSNLSH